jgi:hypothetical protein
MVPCYLVVCGPAASAGFPEHNMVFCATDWWGLASPDEGNDAAALLDLNKFLNVIDRLQQGVLNTLFLGPCASGYEVVSARRRSSCAVRPASPTSRISSGSPIRAAARSAAARVVGVGRCVSQTTRR